MTALAANRETEYKRGETVALPVAASTVIYLGAMVCVNGSGYAVPAADTEGLKLVGVACAKADNSAGAAAAITVEVRRNGIHKFVASGLALNDAGRDLYVADDQTLQLGRGHVRAGYLARFTSATEAELVIEPAARARVALSFTFGQEDATASQAAVALTRGHAATPDADLTEAVMPFACSIVGISCRAEAARTAGTATFQPTINGTVAALSAILDGTNTQSHYAQQEPYVADSIVAPGERIGAKITTDASWAAGTTPSVACDVFVELH